MNFKLFPVMVRGGKGAHFEWCYIFNKQSRNLSDPVGLKGGDHKASLVNSFLEDLSQ